MFVDPPGLVTHGDQGRNDDGMEFEWENNPRNVDEDGVDGGSGHKAGESSKGTSNSDSRRTRVEEVDDEEEVVAGQGYQHSAQLPPIIEKFMGRAGARVSITSTDVKDSNTMYEAALGDSFDHTNPFSPFKSKLDWEVAEWAKLLGPSETSFTKLLAIDEVSFCSRFRSRGDRSDFAYPL